MPDADNNFGGSLVLDFRTWWRHVQPKNSLQSANVRHRPLPNNNAWDRFARILPIMAFSSSSRKSVQAELTDIPYPRKRLCIVLRDTARAFEISVAEMSYDKRYSNCSRGITNLGLPTWLPSSVGTWGAGRKIQLWQFDYKEIQHVTSSRRICSDVPIFTVCIIRNKCPESCSNRCIKKSIVSSLTSGDYNTISR